MKKYSKGFTLIELLVVIAIIGILSSVVLASLNTARSKGADAAVKTTMSQVRNQSSIYYDSHGNTYGTANTCSTGMFSSDTVISSAITYITTNASTPTCFAVNDTWAISTTLKGGGTWCVDSTLVGKVGTAQATGLCI